MESFDLVWMAECCCLCLPDTEMANVSQKKKAILTAQYINL